MANPLITWDKVAETHRRDTSWEHTLCGMRLPTKAHSHWRITRMPELARKPLCEACEKRLEAIRALEALS